MYNSCGRISPRNPKFRHEVFLNQDLLFFFRLDLLNEYIEYLFDVKRFPNIATNSSKGRVECPIVQMDLFSSFISDFSYVVIEYEIQERTRSPLGITQ
jgi:hypothetical protein